MIIYRVEHHKDHVGPFQQRHRKGKLRELLLRHRNYHQNYPPLQDYVHWQYMCEYKCGFKSVNHAVEWFNLPGLLKALRSNGFRLAVYEVEPKEIIFCRTYKQVFFKENAAKLIHKTCLLNIRRYTCNDDFT